MSDERLLAEQRFFDEHYRSEGTALNGFYTVSGARREFTTRVLAAGSGARVLEYGCGTGSHAVELAERGAIVVGIDIAPAAIEIARRKADGRPNLSFVLANAEALEFADGSFDFVCGTSILHHLDTHRAATEIRRVLVAGGRGLFYEPLAYNPPAAVYRLLTPGSHTPDEHPLKVADLDFMRTTFREVSFSTFDLFSVAAIPFLRLPGGRGLLRSLELADRAVLSFPIIRWLGSTAILELHV